MALDVIAAGEIYIDLVMSGFDHTPGPGEEAFAREFRREAGGGPVITALGLARLGRSTGIAGAVGAEDGAWLIERLARGGVDVSRVQCVPDEFTATTFVITDASDRTFFTYAGANRKFKAHIEGATHLHWAAPVDCSVFERIRASGMTISLDIGFAGSDPSALRALTLVDLFFPNEIEGQRMTGESDPEAILRAFEQAGARGVVLKLGARGAATLADGRLLHFDPPEVSPVDTTGAGDCFNAGYLHAWLAGKPPEECLRLGNICGALSTRALGGVAGFPTAEEIDCLLK
ncbi:MAG: sugar kinase [Bryobacteraceae bacterium]|jgi:sugar/nucleoside kinase (ribokinase family)